MYKQFQWKECSGTTLHTFDLKEQYDTCQIEGVYNDYRADVLLTSSQNPDTPPVFLEVSVSHDCTPGKLESGLRIIEMKIRSEADFKRPIVENKGPMVPVKEEPKPQYSYYQYSSHPEPEPSFIMFHNFDRVFHRDDIKKLDFFALFEDGKMGSQKHFLPCKDAGTKYLEASIFELGLLEGGWRGRIDKRNDLLNLGYTQALLHNLPTRNCYYCVNYPRCTVPMEVEQINRRTGQKEKVIQRVYNTRIKSDQINKFELASKCNYWRLNEPLCHQVKSYYQENNIFIWEKSSE